MTLFYIVRHGQTLFNTLDRYQGWCDSPLTELGIQQAEALYPKLKDVPFALAASSSCERAIDTLDYILQDRDVKKEHLKGLREVGFGKLEGSYFPKNKPNDEQHWIGYHYAGGEDRDEAMHRFLDTLESLAVEGNVLIVSHGGVICRTLQHLDDTMPKHVSPAKLVPNCSITKLKYDNGTFEIVSMPSND